MSEILVPGQSGTPLDLYVKAGSTLYDPSSITFIVKDALSFVQGSGSGVRRSVGHYDASSFVITSSGNLGTWTITWSVGGASKIEEFLVQVPTLTEIGDSQNDIDMIKQHIRFDIGDFREDIFTDSQLQIYIDKSVHRLNRELGISNHVRPTGVTPGGIGQPAITPPISIDFLSGTIFPDTDEIIDIVILQTEVLITRAEMASLRRASAASAAAPGAELIVAASGITADSGAGMRVRNADGVEIDTTSRFTSWLTNKTRLFLDEAKAREDELKRAIMKLRSDISAMSSKVVY